MEASEIQEELKHLEEMLVEGTNISFVLEQSKSLLSLVDANTHWQLHASILLQLGKAHFFLGQIDESREIVEHVLQHYSHKDKTICAKALIHLGNIHQQTAQLAESIACFQSALEIYETEQNILGLAHGYTNAGISYRKLADYSTSLEFMDKGRRLYEELGDEAGVAANTGNIGNVYFVMNQYAKALEYQYQALAINEKVNNLRGIANNCLTIGGVHLMTNEYGLADSYFQRASELFEILDDKAGAMHAQSNIGILLDFQEKFEEALALDEEVLKYAIEKDDVSGIATQLVNIGNLYANPKNSRYEPIKAEEYFLKAMDIHIELKQQDAVCSLHKQMSELYERMELWQKSLYHLKEHLQLNDVLISEEAQHKADLFDQRRKLDQIEKERQLEVARFQEQEKILHNILPNTIAERMLNGESNIVDKAEDVSIFFSDIVDFTALTSAMNPESLIMDLNKLFTEFDRIAKKHNVEKIKTIGDAYMAVCGVPKKHQDHALRLANFAFEVMSASKQFIIGHSNVDLRIGIHAGEAIAGIIGEDKYSYDLWGDTVNIASRMENTGEKGHIQVTEHYKQLLDGHLDIIFTSRGEIDIKGKGKMKTYFMHQSNNA
ncbi:MAG: adenylate/guanylate cyclase domain-containing protein [Ignavibacteria bacterium]|jgi:class 3 adenylate cyclase